MAPPTLYERPHVQLRRLLYEAKVAGLTFGEAWVLALRPGKAIVMATTEVAPPGAIRWPTDRSDREAWRLALRESREAWRRAYYGELPTAPEVALVNLAGELALLDRAATLQASREGIDRGAGLVSVA